MMMIIRSDEMPAVTPSAHDDGATVDALGERAAVVFAADLAADRVPSIRAIRAALHVDQQRAQRLREHLAVAVDANGGNLPHERRPTKPAVAGRVLGATSGCTTGNPSVQIPHRHYNAPSGLRGPR
jgi:hypothetical protein